MTLYLIRHGKAEVHTDKDYNRVLHPKGIDQSNFINRFLLKEKTQDYSCLYSSSARTSETMEIATRDLNLDQKVGTKEIYGADYMTIFKQIEQIKSQSSLIVVAHNPGISRLASYLSNEVFHFKTGMMLKIEFDIDAWSEISKDTGIVIDEIRLEQ